eukprot:m.191086 g.191086  ORF g.191086 m.191086 type:complete len:243 (+) comp21719_c0_seq7:91-819(+)
MAGHSKWHNIKHQKAAADQKRGKLFNKLTRDIISAVRVGGSDLTANPRLVSAIDAAKAHSLPKAKIENALRTAASGKEETVTFEVTGPTGVGLIVELYGTDRKALTPDLRQVLNKYNGALGADGSVAWMFAKKGVVTIATTGEQAFTGDKDELAIDVEAEEVLLDDQDDDNSFKLLCDPGLLPALQQRLAERNVQPVDMSVDYLATAAPPELTEEQMENLRTLVQKIEDMDTLARVTCSFPL